MNNIQLIKLLHNMSAKINEHKDYLTELDQPIGDSDHGINMARGFKALEDKLDSLKDKDVSTILKTVGMTLVSQVGGSSGPLYGTAFMYAGNALNGINEITLNDFSIALNSAIEGVKMRGKASVGEATMLDAMVPALDGLNQAINNKLSIKDTLNNVYDKAQQGANSTIPMIATKGRASYVGERAIGHLDPGAQSFAYLMETIKEFY